MLSKDLYDVTLVSPANHFLVTPLLPQTAVGTLEARNVQENVRTIDRLHKYYQAKARTLDVQSQVSLTSGPTATASASASTPSSSPPDARQTPSARPKSAI